MKLILLIDFINQLLNLSEIELTQLNGYLEGLLNSTTRKEETNIMEEELMLPEKTKGKLDINEEQLLTASKNITHTIQLDVIEELQDLKLELEECKSELQNINHPTKGGEQMSEQNIQNCGNFEPDIIEESELPDPDDGQEVDISCIKVLHHNFFDNYELDEETLAENFTINKLHCCVEKVLVRSAVTDCLYPALVKRACGCVEYGVTVEADSIENNDRAIICCDNVICIDQIIDFACMIDTESQFTGDLSCEIDIDIDWTNVTVLKDNIELVTEDSSCSDDEIIGTEEINLANKAAVAFEGTLTLEAN